VCSCSFKHLQGGGTEGFWASFLIGNLSVGLVSPGSSSLLDVLEVMPSNDMESKRLLRPVAVEQQTGSRLGPLIYADQRRLWNRAVRNVL
jgi:hypothetical protein